MKSGTRFLVGLFILAAMIYALPWLGYYTFASAASGLPEKAEGPVESDQMIEAWAAHMGFAPNSPRTEPLSIYVHTPWSFLFNQACGAAVGDVEGLNQCIYRHPGTVPVHDVAEYQMSSHGENIYGPAAYLRQYALQIWVTRHWTADDVARYLWLASKAESGG
jgi:hypothetical protein